MTRPKVAVENVIAEQILDQVDHEGHYGQQIDTILKHKEW